MRPGGTVERVRTSKRAFVKLVLQRVEKANLKSKRGLKVISSGHLVEVWGFFSKTHKTGV